jgi:hypothetical protein
LRCRPGLPINVINEIRIDLQRKTPFPQKVRHGPRGLAAGNMLRQVVDQRPLPARQHHGIVGARL